jgi:hypothetical protein
VEVTDPRHPLFGRRFRVLFIGRPPGRPGHVIVAYRDDYRLRIPIAATNLAAGQVAPPRGKLTRDALRQLVALLKECQTACPQPPNASGADSPTT